jgi:hypothetical protein
VAWRRPPPRPERVATDAAEFATVPPVPSDPLPPWRFSGVTRVHPRSLAPQFLLQIGLLQAVEMRRETSRVSFLMCPFCVRAASPNTATSRSCSDGEVQPRCPDSAPRCYETPLSTSRNRRAGSQPSLSRVRQTWDRSSGASPIGNLAEASTSDERGLTDQAHRVRRRGWRNTTSA